MRADGWGLGLERGEEEGGEEERGERKRGENEERTIAGVITVAVHEVNFDAVVEEVSEILDLAAADVGAGVIADAVEGFINAVGGLGVIDGNTEGALDVVLAQIPEVVVWREWGRVDGSDVVIVASRNHLWSKEVNPLG